LPAHNHSESACSLIDRSEIEGLIPHGAMWLMLDRVIECVPGSHGIAECDLHADAAWFEGHFPDRHVMPGALIIEACAQLVAVTSRMASGLSPAQPAIDMLASVERFKFVSPAVPNETLTVEARLARRLGGLRRARVSARIGARPVAEGVVDVTEQRVLAG
jgi:3-hydroxyacyl-[acyl-carrier-protein] dehydratase